MTSLGSRPRIHLGAVWLVASKLTWTVLLRMNYAIADAPSWAGMSEMNTHNCFRTLKTLTGGDLVIS